MAKPIRSIVLLVSDPALETHLKEQSAPSDPFETQDDLRVFHRLLSHSSKSVITKTKAHSSLVNILGFTKSLSEGQKAISSSLPDRVLTEKSGSQGASLDEDVTEVKTVTHPKKVQEILSGARAFLLTTNQLSKGFANEASLDYIFSPGCTESTSFLKDFLAKEPSVLKDYDVVFVEMEELSKNGVEKGVLVLEQTLQWVIAENHRLYICFENLLNSRTIPEIEKLREKSLLTKDAILRDEIIQKVLPLQTSHYFMGNEEKEASPVEETKPAFVLFYAENSCRMDGLVSIKEIEKDENLRKVSGGVIKAEYFLREILFKLGKLPKFGA